MSVPAADSPIITVLEGADLMDTQPAIDPKHYDPMYAAVYSGGKLIYQRIPTEASKAISALTMADYLKNTK